MDVTQKFSVQLFVYHVIVLLKMCSNVCILQQLMHQRPQGLERNEDQVEEIVENEKELYKKGEVWRRGADQNGPA
jgi:hypothetical protein